MISVVTYKGFSKTFCLQQASSSTDWEAVDVKGACPAEAYNMALRQVRGEYVLFLDENERVNLSALEGVNKSLLDEDFLVFDFVCHYSDGREELRMPNTYHVSVRALLRATIVDDYPGQVSNILFKKTTLDTNEISFQSDLNSYMETFFFVSVLNHSKKYRYVNVPLMHCLLSQKWGTQEYTVGGYVSYCRYYRALTGILDKSELKIIDNKVFEKKVCFMEHTLLNTRNFNREIETPLAVFWSANWSLIRKLKYTGMFFFTKLVK